MVLLLICLHYAGYNEGLKIGQYGKKKSTCNIDNFVEVLVLGGLSSGMYLSYSFPYLVQAQVFYN